MEDLFRGMWVCVGRKYGMARIIFYCIHVWSSQRISEKNPVSHLWVLLVLLTIHPYRISVRTMLGQDIAILWHTFSRKENCVSCYFSIPNGAWLLRAVNNIEYFLPSCLTNNLQIGCLWSPSLRTAPHPSLCPNPFGEAHTNSCHHFQQRMSAFPQVCLENFGELRASDSKWDLKLWLFRWTRLTTTEFTMVAHVHLPYACGWGFKDKIRRFCFFFSPHCLFWVTFNKWPFLYILKLVKSL